MASVKEFGDDEYIGKLLAKDARESSIKYSALGLQALLPKRPINSAPKPNTRFLKSIIRETDSHNAALKKKEELEARMRLREIRYGAARPGSRGEHERERKRRRIDDVDDHDKPRNQRRGAKIPRSSSEERVESREKRRQHGGDGSRRGAEPTRLRPERHSSHHIRRERYGRPTPSRRSRSSSIEESRHLDRRKRRRKRSSHSDSSDCSDGTNNDRTRKKHRRPTHSSQPQRRHASFSRPRNHSVSSRSEPACPPKRHMERHVDDQSKTMNTLATSADSDPLETFVGPLPPIPTVKDTAVNDRPPLTSRGRGAYRPSASAMDAHFSSTYNPSLDLHPDSEQEDEKEDWDMALEALRDREIWKQKGAERLRAAGFGEDEVKKWEDSGKEKGAEDVRWTAKGEAREWDIGKVVRGGVGERKGDIGVEAAWKRKGGGLLRDLKRALQ